MHLATKLRRRLANEESGFTLIELLVVLVIIGILLAIAVPSAEAYYSDKSTYAGMTVGALKSIDSGLASAVSVGSTLTSTSYCLQATVGTFPYHYSGPGGTVTSGACP